MEGDVRGKTFPASQYSIALAHKEACGGLLVKVHYMGLPHYEVRYIPVYHSFEEQKAFEAGLLPINPS